MSFVPFCGELFDGRGDVDDRLAEGQAAVTVVRRADKEQVGLGSYFINSMGNCNDCHSAQWFATGGNPFLGQPEEIDQATYLTGGRSFGPTISRNLRPEIGTGLPAGLTSEQFLNAMTQGTDYDNPGQLLQVMPWPYFHDMTNQDIQAIYAYLSTLSAVPPGSWNDTEHRL